MFNPFKRKEEQEIVQPSIEEQMEIVEQLQKRLDEEDLNDEQKAELGEEIKHRVAVINQRLKDAGMKMIKIGALVGLVIVVGLGAVVVMSNNNDTDEPEEADDSDDSEENEENEEESE